MNRYTTTALSAEIESRDCEHNQLLNSMQISTMIQPTGMITITQKILLQPPVSGQRALFKVKVPRMHPRTLLPSAWVAAIGSIGASSLDKMP
jgi:hypothetical protein